MSGVGGLTGGVEGSTGGGGLWWLKVEVGDSNRITSVEAVGLDDVSFCIIIRMYSVSFDAVLKSQWSLEWYSNVM